MPREHFSFGGHAAEDVRHLPRVILHEARVFFETASNSQRIYFREGATNSESWVRRLQSLWRTGTSIFDLYLADRLPDQRARSTLRTTLKALEYTANGRTSPSDDVGYLYRLDQRLGGTLFSGAEMYFLERLRRKFEERLERPSLDRNVKLALIEKYREDVLLLERLTGISCRHWLE